MYSCNLCHLQPLSVGEQWKHVILLRCCQTTFTDTWHAKTQDQHSDVCIHSITPTTVFPPFSHPDSAKEGNDAEQSAAYSSFQAKRAGFLHCDQQFLIQHDVGRVRRQVQAVEAGMSPDRDTSRVLRGQKQIRLRAIARRLKAKADCLSVLLLPGTPLTYRQVELLARCWRLSFHSRKYIEENIWPKSGTDWQNWGDVFHIPGSLKGFSATQRPWAAIPKQFSTFNPLFAFRIK